MSETHAEAVERLTAGYVPVHEKLVAAGIECLTVVEWGTCLREGTAKRGTPRILKSAPSFYERPYGSAFIRLYRWHGGNGQLDGYYSVKWDIDGNDAIPSFDAFDNTVIAVRGGSPAAEAWKKAIGG
tara:strand:+ start:515 stop:895 length:381 start_codon:yes stop_codon:yes gene_type:complete